MGSAHAQAYAAMRDVEIAGIASRGSERAERLADALDVQHVTDPYALLDDESVEAIDVTLPTHLHREHVVAALERGKHVFCENPVAWSVEDAEAMLEASADEDIVLAAGLLTRFVPEYVEVRELVEDGGLGEPRAVYASRLSPPYWVDAGSRAATHYGDAIEELATLDLDFAHWLLGPATEVSAVGARGPRGWVDHAFVSYDPGGVSTLVEAGADLPPSFPFRTQLRVVCEAGAVEATTVFPGDGPPVAQLVRFEEDGAPERIDVPSVNPVDAQCRYFVDCTLGEEDPARVSLRHAVEALRVVAAARESMVRGVPVELVR